MTKYQKGFIQVIISGLVFGFMPSITAYCYAQGISTTSMLVIRYLVSMILFYPAVQKAGDLTGIVRRHWKHFLPIGFFSALTALLLFSSYHYLPTGMCTTLHFMYPSMVVLLSLVFLHEKPSRIKFICLALCILGVLLMVDLSAQSINILGVALALASSVSYAIYIISLDKMNMDDLSTMQLMFFKEASDLVFIGLIYGPLTQTFQFHMSLSGWIVCLAANVIICIFGHLFFAQGVRYTDAQVSAIASTMEPLTSLVVGVLFLSEPFSARGGIGVAAILTAVILLSLYGEKG